MTDIKSASPIISVEHLQKNFGDHVVLRDISFDVCQGDVVSIIGPRGSGKSTLLRCINFLAQPTGGKILFHGNMFLKGVIIILKEVNRLHYSTTKVPV